MGSGSARWSQIVAAMPGSSTSGSGCFSCLCRRSSDCASITAGAGSRRAADARFARFRTALLSDGELDRARPGCALLVTTLSVAAAIAAAVLGDALSGEAVSGAASGAASAADSAGASAAGSPAACSVASDSAASWHPSVESSASQSLWRELLHSVSSADAWSDAVAAACWFSTACTSRSPAPAEKAAPAKNSVANDKLTAARRKPDWRFGLSGRSSCTRAPARRAGRSAARQTAASESRTRRVIRLGRRCLRSGMCLAPISR